MVTGPIPGHYETMVLRSLVWDVRRVENKAVLLSTPMHSFRLLPILELILSRCFTKVVSGSDLACELIKNWLSHSAQLTSLSVTDSDSMDSSMCRAKCSGIPMSSRTSAPMLSCVSSSSMLSDEARSHTRCGSDRASV